MPTRHWPATRPSPSSAPPYSPRPARSTGPPTGPTPTSCSTPMPISTTRRRSACSGCTAWMRAGSCCEASRQRGCRGTQALIDLFRVTAARMSALSACSSILSPSWKSMARLVLPSRLELKRPEGSSNEAPLAKVIFTAFLYVSPVQMIPACDHTGTPLHFHSSTTSGSACLMRVRIRASVSPRQSLSSLILASISREGESPPFPSVAPLVFFFMVVVAFFIIVPRTGRSHSFAGQLARLLYPAGELSFVELVVLMDVEVALVLARGLAGRDRTQRCAAEESHLDVVGEGMDAEEPAMALDSVKRRVPFDCLAHEGDGAHDQRVEAARRRVSSPAWPRYRPARGCRRRP